MASSPAREMAGNDITVELRSAAFVEQTLEINGHFTGFTPTVYDYAARCGIECMLTLLHTVKNVFYGAVFRL